MPDLSFNRKYWTDNAKALAKKQGKDAYYGIHWGDPKDPNSPLFEISTRFVNPYIDSYKKAIEIGPGGGRWTQFLLGFRQLYCVDINNIMFGLLKEQFPKQENLTFIQNNGTDFPRIADNSIDYVFSFGVFVHLEPLYIYDYLLNLKPKLKQGANVILQYSDKTKKQAQNNQGFALNKPDIMRAMITYLGYSILEEDLELLPHSSIIRFSI